MRDHQLDGHEMTDADRTPDEPWTMRREHNHFYGMQADFVLSALGSGPGECLVVGSPCFEAMELAEKGWSVTHVDVRSAPDMGAGVRRLRADVVSEPLPTGAFDCGASTCVMCHLGMGRYGDLPAEWADVAALHNIYRSLKDGAKFVLTWGPVSFLVAPVLARMHRIYTVGAARDRAAEVGFRILEERILDGGELVWKAGGPNVFEFDRDYLTMVLAK